MKKPRRKANDALETDPKVNAFIEKGVAPSDLLESQTNASKETLNERTPRLNDDIKNLPHESISKRKRKRRPRANGSIVQSPSWASSAYSKATIQKTVRFNPQLISRWERLNQSTHEKGQATQSFQKTQNEALELWLNSKQC